MHFFPQNLTSALNINYFKLYQRFLGKDKKKKNKKPKPPKKKFEKKSKFKIGFLSRSG